MQSAGLCVRFLLYLTLIIYCPEHFIIIFIKKKVFRVTEYRFWYSIIGCSSEYPVNWVLVAIPSIFFNIMTKKFELIYKIMMIYNYYIWMWICSCRPFKKSHMLINGCSLLAATITGTPGKDTLFFVPQISKVICLFLKPTLSYRKEHFMRKIYHIFVHIGWT
jgi:hypothetical protein